MNQLAYKSFFYPTILKLFSQTTYGEGAYNESIYNGETIVTVGGGSSSTALSNTGMAVLAFVTLGVLLIVTGIIVNLLRKRNKK